MRNCVFLETKENKLSLNALAGALELFQDDAKTRLHFEPDINALRARVAGILAENALCAAGFSFFSSRFETFAENARLLRAEFGAKLKIIAGGPHATAMPESVLNAGADIACIGEGEETFPEILSAVFTDGNRDAVRGIAFIENGVFVKTPARAQVDIEKYPSIAKKYEKYGAVEISRGCPHGCKFCQTTRLFGPNIRHRSPRAIAEQLKIMRDVGFIDARLITSNAFAYGSPDGLRLNLPELENLLQAMKEATAPGGKIFFGSFPSEVRPEHVTRETVSLVKKYAANDNLIIGAQSGSERMLKLSNRHHTAAEIRQAVRITTEAGLKANLDFIFGLPGETPEDARLSINFIKEIAGPRVKIHAHTFMPLPGTPFANEKPNPSLRLYEKLIDELMGQGFLYGTWETQKAHARKLAARHNKS